MNSPLEEQYLVDKLAGKLLPTEFLIGGKGKWAPIRWGKGEIGERLNHPLVEVRGQESFNQWKSHLIDWDTVKFDTYKLINNFREIIDINIDIDNEVNNLIKQLKDRYELV